MMRFDKSLKTTEELLKGKNFYERSRQLMKVYKDITNKEFYYLSGRLFESGGDIFVDKKGNRFTIAGGENSYHLWYVR